MKILIIALFFSYNFSGKGESLKAIFNFIKAQENVKQESTTNTTTPETSSGIALEGTMMMGNKRVALINGEAYSIGESIKNYKIIDISLKNIILHDEEGNELTIGLKE